MKKIKTLSILLVLMASLALSACGSESCGGTIFVNQSGEVVIVSAGSLSDIQFDTFTLADGEENKVCGNDTDGINADYEWPNGDTYNKGATYSGGDFCMYLLSSHTAELSVCL